MISQYGSFRQQLDGGDWSVSTSSGGNLTGSGTISFYLQSHNRTGVNLLSEPKTISYSSGNKIVITVNESAIASGEDVFKFVLSAGIDGSTPVQIAEIFARESNLVTFKPFPLFIELSENAHISTNIADGLTTNNNRIHGQIRKQEGVYYRYDSLAITGAIASTPGYWVVDTRAGFVAIANTNAQYGCDRPTQIAEITIPSIVSVTPAMQTEPIVFWWANRASSSPGAIVLGGTYLNFAISVNDATVNSNNVSYASLFDSLISTRFLGYVDLATGELDTGIEGVGITKPWRPDNSGLFIPEDLLNGYAAAWEVEVSFASSVVNDLITQGASISLDLVQEPNLPIYNPVAGFTGDVILPQWDMLRFVPIKLLSGSGVIDGYQFQSRNISAISGILEDTPNQKVVISPTMNGLAQVKNTLLPNEVIRAIFSTEGGTQKISSFSNIILLESPLDTAGLSVTISLPEIDSNSESLIRSDYPDVVAGMKGFFNPTHFKVYLARATEFEPDEYGNNIPTAWEYYEYPNAVLLNPNSPTTITIDEFGDVVEESELPSDLSFGLFEYGDIEVTTIPNAGNLTAWNTYKVAIAYYYPSPNATITKISHSPTDGCIPEVGGNLVDTLNAQLSWLPKVGNASALRQTSSTYHVNGGIVFAIAEQSLYWFNATSTAVDDGTLVLKPTIITGAGRFIKIVTSGGGGGGSSIVDELLSVFGPKPAVAANLGQGPVVISAPEEATEETYVLATKPNYVDNVNELEFRGLTGLTASRIIDSSLYEQGGIVYASGADSTEQEYRVTRILSNLVYNTPTEGFVVTDMNFTNEGQPLQLKSVYRPTGVSGSYVAVSTNNIQFDVKPFTLGGLDDTYLDSLEPIQNNHALLFDGALQKWRPGVPNISIFLANLNDVFIENPQERQSFVWDATLGKMTLGSPDLSHVQGLGQTTQNITILGDAQWVNTKVIVSARNFGRDLRGTFESLTVVNAIAVTGSPYGGAGFSYQFSNNSRQYVQIPTTPATLIGSNFFCIEMWFKPSELTSGKNYVLAQRSNGVESDFALRIQEVGTVGQHQVRFEAYPNALAGQTSLPLSTLTSSVSGGLQLNTWYHLAVTRNGNDFRLFINGQQQGQQTNTPALRTTFTNNNAIFLVLGRVNQSPSYDGSQFIGNIEDFRLTIGNARYISNFTPPITSLPVSAGGVKQVKNFFASFKSLTDVDGTVTPLEDYVPAWSTTLQKYVPKPVGTSGVISLTLGQLTNVDITGATANQFLQRGNDGVWRGVSIGAGVTSVNGESGVVTLTTDDIPQGTNNLYLTPGAIASELGNVTLEQLSNVANTISDNLYLQKVSGQWVGQSIDFPVTSVNNKTGAVVINTSDIAEGTNLYYTDIRADARINNATIAGMQGVFTGLGTIGQVPALNGDGKLTFIDPPFGEGGGAVSSVNGQIGVVTLTSTNIAEGTNLYYTNARVDSRLGTATIATLTGVFASTGTTGQYASLDANGKIAFVDAPSGTGAVSSVNGETGTVVLTTADIAEENNLYYTNDRADARIANATISSMTGVFAGVGAEGQMAFVDANGKVAFSHTVARQQFRDVTGNHTLEASDHGKIIRITNTSTVTLPNGLPAGFQCTLFNLTQTVTTLSTTGTLQATSNIMRLQFVATYVTHVGSNTWIAIGRLD